MMDTQNLHLHHLAVHNIYIYTRYIYIRMYVFINLLNAVNINLLYRSLLLYN